MTLTKTKIDAHYNHVDAHYNQIDAHCSEIDAASISLQHLLHVKVTQTDPEWPQLLLKTVVVGRF
jgi:hypothetical protein